MAYRAKPGKITSFFGAKNGSDDMKVKNKDDVHLNKEERLALLLNNMKSHKQQISATTTSDGLGDASYYEHNLAKIEAKKKRKRQNADQSGISKDILDQINGDLSHGPTWGDHTEGKGHWTGYFEQKNKKLRKQFKLSDRSVYGDLSSNGVHFNKKTVHKHHEDRLNSATKVTAKRSRISDDLKCSNNNINNSECGQSKRRKLNASAVGDCDEKGDTVETAEEEEFEGVFKRVTVYFNGRTGDLSNFHLKKVITLNGGNFRVNMSKDVTHVITNSLSRSKIKRAVEKMGKARASHAFYVRAAWITDSVRLGKLMKEEDYLVFKTKKYGNLNSYFTAK